MKKILTLALLCIGFTALSFSGHAEESSNPDHKKHGKHSKAGFKKMDLDGDGKVSKEEFIARSEKRFSHIDKNNDGTISKKELKKHKASKKKKHHARKKRQANQENTVD